MLNTSFAGKIDLLGSGRFQSNWFIKRSVIKMGSRKLRQVVVSDALDDFLDASVENESNVQMAVGWAPSDRWPDQNDTAIPCAHPGYLHAPR